MSDNPAPMLPWPSEDFSRYGEIEVRQLSRTQSHVARVMHRNWVSIPHVTHHDDADITTGFEDGTYHWPYKIIGVPVYAIIALVVLHSFVQLLLVIYCKQKQIQDPIYTGLQKTKPEKHLEEKSAG